MSRWARRTAPVAGPSTGTGRAAARLLAARGSRVRGTGRTPEQVPAAGRLRGAERPGRAPGGRAPVDRRAEEAGRVAHDMRY
ncbi:hypothetical protein [Kitasatospora sp. NPDC057198]|uniref:hypothetical protein n=1 Tax=Kitasatospora sp. NPDC057198 TaxID=3346046 RepID=UPI00362533B2